MGKGSNVQKKQQAQLRNQKDRGKSDGERKAASDKAKKDAAAFMCEVCRQTFMVNAKPPVLYEHVLAKHPPGTSPTECFPVILKDFDPNNPDKAPEKSVKRGPPRKKKTAKTDDLDALLDAGLTLGVKKNKK